VRSAAVAAPPAPEAARADTDLTESAKASGSGYDWRNQWYPVRVPRPCPLIAPRASSHRTPRCVSLPTSYPCRTLCCSVEPPSSLLSSCGAWSLTPPLPGSCVVTSGPAATRPDAPPPVQVHFVRDVPEGQPQRVWLFDEPIVVLRRPGALRGACPPVREACRGRPAAAGELGACELPLLLCQA